MKRNSLILILIGLAVFATVLFFAFRNQVKTSIEKDIGKGMKELGEGLKTD